MATDRGTYDDRQINAVLVTCQQCGKALYHTHPHQPCYACARVLIVHRLTDR